ASPAGFASAAARTRRPRPRRPPAATPTGAHARPTDARPQCLPPQPRSRCTGVPPRYASAASSLVEGGGSGGESLGGGRGDAGPVETEVGEDDVGLAVGDVLGRRAQHEHRRGCPTLVEAADGV